MPEISQTELFESNNDSLQLKIHTALPARVVSFNASEQTVQIELMIQQMNHNGEPLDLPPLVDVPVQMWAFGQFSITAEPQKGDEGLAHFSERCIDGWWYSSQKSIPLDIRFHDLSDAFFSGGYRSKPKALTFYSGAMNIGSDNAYIRLTESSITVGGKVVFLEAPEAPDFITSSGVSTNDHTHGNVQTGSGSTGKPQ